MVEWLSVVGAFLGLVSLLVKVWLEKKKDRSRQEMFVNDLKRKLELQKVAVVMHDLDTINALTDSLLLSAGMLDQKSRSPSKPDLDGQSKIDGGDAIER